MKAVSVQVLGSLHRAMESTALLNRIVWEEVINKCKEESFRIHMSFRVAHIAAGTAVGGNQEVSGTAESSWLTSAGTKQQPGAAFPAKAGSQSPEIAEVCIADKGSEATHASGPPSNGMTALQEKQILADVASPVSIHNLGSGAISGPAARQGSAARLSSSALSGLGPAFRAHEARCRAVTGTASAADPRIPGAADALCTPQPGEGKLLGYQAGTAAASTSGNDDAQDGLWAPPAGATDVPVVPSVGRTGATHGLHAPQPEAAFSSDSPPAARECTGGESPVKSVFASMQSLPGASDSTSCRCDLVIYRHT